MTAEQHTEPRAAQRAAAVSAAIPAWTKHLAALGGPNALLWFGDHQGATLDLSRAHPAGLAKLLSGKEIRLSDMAREARAIDEARRRVRALVAEVGHLEAAHGLHTCFVAMGMATWTLRTPPGRDTARVPAAPVLLRPCRLVPTDDGQSDYTFDLGPVELNPALEHYLRAEAGIVVDPAAIERLAEHDGSVDPEPAYAALTAACADLPGFTVEPRVVTAAFTPTKAPMVADLAQCASDLEAHELVGALAGQPLDFPAAERPDRGTVILDTDSAQDEVIAAARSGTSLVVDAPPGTGATQVVVTLLAAFAADGKRVLFAPAGRRAVEDAAARLAEVDLGGLLLDLGDGPHSRGALASLLGPDPDSPPSPDPRRADPSPDKEVERERLGASTQLERHTRALHEPFRPWGVCLYDALEAVSALTAGPGSPRSRVRWRGVMLERVHRQAVDALATQLTTLAEQQAWRTDRLPDPWWGASVAGDDEARALRAAVERLAGDPTARSRALAGADPSAPGPDDPSDPGPGGPDEPDDAPRVSSLDALDATMREVFAEVTLPPARTVGDWGRLLETISSLCDTFEVFRTEIFDRPIQPLVDATAPRDGREGAAQSGWERRQHRLAARRLLRPGTPPEDLHGALRAAMEQRAAWRELAGAGSRPEPPARLDDARSAYAAVAADLRLVAAHALGDADLLEVDRAELTRRVVALASTPDRLAVVPTVHESLTTWREKGFGELLDDFARRGMQPGAVRSEVEFVWWASLVDELSARQRIERHDGRGLRRTARDFARHDRALLSRNAARVSSAVATRRAGQVRADPQAVQRLCADTAATDRAGLRDLLTRHRDLVAALHPCWAVAPWAAAALLPPGQWFDVVIVDAADRLPVPEVVSVLARARQVVVLGDLSLQTAYPSSEGADPVGSSLTALAATLPVLRLRRDHRSHDERLTAFVRERLYPDLEVLPGIERGPVVVHQVVDGTGLLDPATSLVETTDAEVSAAVARVLVHSRTHPDETVAVVTLGERHAERVGSALRTALRAIPERAAGPVTVMPAAWAHDGLWDHVVLSVGYGRTPHGRMLHRFGPLGEPGGAHDLLRAITRARRRLTVVSAFAAGDLDVARLEGAGPRLLHDLLTHLEGAPADDPGEAPASALVHELAEHLRGQGLVVHERYGHGADVVDLAVEDPAEPERLLVAVETDGPAYAALPTPRERDRLRPEHLQRIGWRHARVWSVDIFRDPAPDVERIRALAVAVQPSADGDDDEDDDQRDESAAGEAGGKQGAGAGDAADEGADDAANQGPPTVGPSRAVAPEMTEPQRRRPRRASSAAYDTARRRPTQGEDQAGESQQTRDDTDLGWGEAGDDHHDERARWLKEQRPPHWG